VRKRTLGRSIPLTIFVTISVLVLGVLGAYTAHFILSRTATVRVLENIYEVGLFEDEGLNRTIVTLNFPNVIQGSPDKSTLEFYIALLKPLQLTGKDVRALWRVKNLPEGMTLTAEWLNGGTWMNWNQNTYSLTLSIDYPLRKVKFTLDPGNTPPGDYAFTIEIEVGEWT